MVKSIFILFAFMLVSCSKSKEDDEVKLKIEGDNIKIEIKGEGVKNFLSADDKVKLALAHARVKAISETLKKNGFKGTVKEGYNDFIKDIDNLSLSNLEGLKYTLSEGQFTGGKEIFATFERGDLKRVSYQDGTYEDK